MRCLLVYVALTVLAACAADVQEPLQLPWSKLTSWEYVDGLQGMPQEVRDLSGTRVALEGCIYPVTGTEFLLVRSPDVFAKCASDVNTVVQVTVPESARGLRAETTVRVVGAFTVGATYSDGYCVDVYQLQADTVVVRK